MSGRVFAIVGPSGVGKDTLIAAVKARRPSLYVVRRVITRPEAAGGEAFEGVSAQEFDRREQRGAFVLSWAAHGLRYGIPAEAGLAVEQGMRVLFNGSRGMLAEAAQVFEGLRVISVTASRAVLAERLSARGRESREEIAARLDRARLPLPQGLNVTRIDNSGALGDAVKAMLAALDDEMADV